MKTNNPVIDTLVESQTQFVNNWIDSAKKMQSAFTNGNIATEGTSLYKEYFDKQMGILNTMQQSSAGMFNNNSQEGSAPLDVFKNWFNQQANYAKQMADFNQSIQNSFASFGKPAQDYMSNFGQANTAFTNIYNSWLNALNTSYDAMSKNMNNTFNKDVFSHYMQGNQMYAKMQEFFQPMTNMMKNGQFSMDSFKNMFAPEQYTNLSKQMFGSFYNEASIKEAYDNGIKQLQSFFTSQNNLGKEYYAQMQDIAKNMPQLMAGTAAGNLEELYKQMHNVFGKTFEPLMKLVNPGKEKENAEATIALMDRIADYSIKQAELQAMLQSTAKTAMEKVAQNYSEKMKDLNSYTHIPSAQELYSEWVKVNEQLFAELFSSEAFSRVKGEALNLSMDVKKYFEKQFESTFENFPVVFKSEVEELQKNIYDLKKQVKELQTKLAMHNAATVELEDDKNGKARKK